MHHTKPLPIRTVIFDFGGVFTESPPALIRRAAVTAGVDEDPSAAISTIQDLVLR